MVSNEELTWAKKYWTTANYIAASSVYLRNNFLLERKLEVDDIKDSLLGHWGTCPGINFVYTHLNLLAKKNKQEMLLVTGPGHGFAAILANLFLEGSLVEYYPELKNNREGVGKLIKAFCWPDGFPSHINPGVPGAIHEGGELGYALATAFGAAFDNPNLIVPVIVGDGESETGPTATAWHSTKFLNPKRDGAVLPIVHLNGYKINNPTIYSLMNKEELIKLFEGYGYKVYFVGPNHKEMAETMEKCFKEIKRIQKTSPKNPKWPMIIMRTPKGWTTVKTSEGKKIEGSWRAHQVPLPNVKSDKEEFRLLEKWLRSYNPRVLFPGGRVPKETLKFVPTGKLRIGSNINANGGEVLKDLVLPNTKEFEFKSKKRGEEYSASMQTLGKYFERLIKINKTNNFRIFSPDEFASNKLDNVLKVTGRDYYWNTKPEDKKGCDITSSGKVMEMLSEHTLQGWLQGYILTGRHGFFPSYEAFLPIVDSMISQYMKFLKFSHETPWRKPVASLNYILTSVCWRQDHNGFSHQNPGFIDLLLSKESEEKFVSVYLPADANMALAVTEKVLKSRSKVNAIVGDKRLIRQWTTLPEARKQVEVGAGVWKFASDENPDIVLAACGDYQTQEMLAARALLKEKLPFLKIRFVNVNEVNVLGGKRTYANALTNEKFEEIFTKNKEVIFSFHGYPSTIKQLLFDRPNNQRFNISGYVETGTTSTPFQILVMNKVSRYHIFMRVIEKLKKSNPKIKLAADALKKEMEEGIKKHQSYIDEHGADPKEINEWKPMLKR